MIIESILMNNIKIKDIFHFKEEMAASVLNYTYGINSQDNTQLYTGHDYSWNEKYRILQQGNLEIQEENRFIRIRYSFSKIFSPMQIISNKDNHMYNRVYIPFSESESGPYFYIKDEKVLELLNLPSDIVRELEEKAINLNNQIEKNEVYRQQLEKDINDLNFNVTFDKALITTARDFLLKTKKGIKAKNYYISLVNYEADLNKIYDELNKFYKE